MTAGTTSAYTPTSNSTKTAVANYLLDNQGDWVDGASLREVGGAAATRRVRELRAEGWSIRHRRNPEATLHFQYRLTRVPNKKVRSQFRVASA